MDHREAREVTYMDFDKNSGLYFNPRLLRETTRWNYDCQGKEMTNQRENKMPSQAADENQT